MLRIFTSFFLIFAVPAIAASPVHFDAGRIAGSPITAVDSLLGKPAVIDDSVRTYKVGGWAEVRVFFYNGKANERLLTFLHAPAT